jgi:hypothetical protein
MRMQKRKQPILRAIVALVFTITCVFANNAPALAVVAGDWRAGNIIDDVVFYNQFAMNASQIQQFLNAKVPVCDNWGTKPYGNTTRRAYSEANGISMPLTCVKDFSENGRSAAQIIWDASQQYHINPQVIIATIQKEQTLITDDWPWPYQYRSATGYGCPDTPSPSCDSTYYGFTNQVNKMASQMQHYASSPNSFNHIPGQNNQVRFNPATSCGSSTVFIENMATASLYNYTPYQPNQAALNDMYGQGDSCSAHGNRNFWRIFSDWFGSTHTNGKWLRQSTANGQVWLVAEGQMPDGSYARKKFRMPNWEVVEAYHLQYDQIVQVSEDYLSQYTDDGTMTTTASSVGPGIDFFQFIDNGRRFDITSGEYCAKNLDGSTNSSTTWGINCFDTNYMKIIPGNEFLSRLSYSGTLPKLLTFSGVTYKMQGGKRLPFYDQQSMAGMGFAANQTTTFQGVNSQQPLGPLQINHTAVVSFAGGPFLIYDSDTGEFHSAGSLDTFNAWRLYNLAKPVPPSSYDTTPPTVTSPALDAFATDGTNKYVIDDGRKVNVNSIAGTMTGVTWRSTAQSLLATLPTATVSNNLWDKTTGAVYILESGKKRLIPNWANFVALGVPMGQLLPLSPDNLSHIPSDDYKIADSLLFYTSASGVNMVNNGQRLHIPDWSFIDNFRLDTGSMVNNHASLDTAYPSGGTLSSLVRKSNGEMFLVTNGQRLAIGEPVRAAWGSPVPGSALQLSDTNINRLPLTGELSKFFIYNGGIYYAQGGQKHHVQSWTSFINLGGGALPVTVPQDFFNTIPLGSPIP